MMVFKKTKTLRFQVILRGRVYQSTAFLYFSALKFTSCFFEVGVGVVGKSGFKENPKSDLDLDLGFVNFRNGKE